MILRSSLIGLSVFSIAAAAAPGEPLLRAQRWIAPGADMVRELTFEPAECLAEPVNEEARRSVEIGRAAFRSPLTLGGQAARAGISCESCHLNGGTNPIFQFPGLSGAPGTADVTSSLISSHRGDGADNPRPIPDLGRRSPMRVSRASGDLALRTFIHGLVTEEFDGYEPSPAVMEGLVDYVRALEPSACPREARLLRTVSRDMHNARRAAVAARFALIDGDGDTAIAMLGAARSELAKVDERYDTPELQALRDEVRRHAIRLGQIRIQRAEPHAHLMVTAWLRQHDDLERRLRAREVESLYNPARLASAIRAGTNGSAAAR